MTLLKVSIGSMWVVMVVVVVCLLFVCLLINIPPVGVCGGSHQETQYQPKMNIQFK